MSRLSVIVPVLDEAVRIEDRLRELVRTPGIDEVLVVDGGSRDGTPAIAARVDGVRVVRSDRGRGVQLAAGADQATGDVLLFHHVDCRLPAGAPSRIRSVLSRTGVVAGAFRTRHVLDDPHSWWLRRVLPMADLRSSYTGLPYGDQALFVGAEVYRRAGGYRPLPIFEDVDLARRLWAFGRIEVVADRVEVSARRYARRPLRTAVVVNTFPLLWWLGVSERRLAGWYGGPPER